MGFWTVCCDKDGNGEYNEGELISSVLTKSCKAVNNAESLWEINCGSGKETRQCGVALSDASAIRNSNSKPLPVLAECIKVVSAKKMRWKYTCDRNENGIADDDEPSKLVLVNKKKFHNVDFDCGTEDTCFDCKKSTLKSFVNTANKDAIITECVETNWSKGKATYTFGCDANGNGKLDEDENSKDVIVTVNSDGECTRKVFDFECGGTTDQTTTEKPETTDKPSTSEATTGATTTQGSTSSECKILALHGGGGSSSSFRNQAGIVDLRQELAECEFVFADAPHGGLRFLDPPGGGK